MFSLKIGLPFIRRYIVDWEFSDCLGWELGQNKTTYLVMRKMTLFLHKNTHHTIPCKKSYFFLSIHFLFSSTTSVFVSPLWSKVSYSFWWHLVYIRNSKRNNSIMYSLWYSLQVRKKWKLKEVSDVTVKLQGFCFFSLSF